MAVSQLLVSMELFLNINTGNVIHMYWTTINIVLISCPLYSFIVFLNKRGNSISRTISTLFLTLEIPFLLHLMQMTDSNLSLTYVFCPWRSMRTYFSVFPHLDLHPFSFQKLLGFLFLPHRFIFKSETFQTLLVSFLLLKHLNV